MSIRDEAYCPNRPALKIIGFRFSFISLQKLGLSGKTHLDFDFFGPKPIWAKTDPKTRNFSLNIIVLAKVRDLEMKSFHLCLLPSSLLACRRLKKQTKLYNNKLLKIADKSLTSIKHSKYCRCF